MKVDKGHGGIIVVATLVVAMALRIAPFPRDFSLFNPDWVVLVIIYWCMALPERCGIGCAWLIGLLTDVLTGKMLGQYALAYSIVAFLCLKMHQRLRLFPVPQQALSILFYLILSQSLVFWVQGIRQIPAINWTYWAPSFIGACIWPVLFVGLRLLRRNFKIQ